MDLIDKQEVRLIESDADAYPQEWNDDYEKGFCDAVHKVLELPTIDAQPVKHGHWINHFDDLFPKESTIECSVCHEHSPADMSYDNFCPNCGADMRGEQDDKCRQV